VKVKAQAKAAAEAKAAEEQRRLHAMTKAAGTTFALLGMDTDEDDTESEEEAQEGRESPASRSPAPAPKPPKDMFACHPLELQARGTPFVLGSTHDYVTRAEEAATSAACRVVKAEAEAETQVVEEELAAVAAAEVKAAEAKALANQVWWGSEAEDHAQRCPLPVTVAVYSHKGEHKLHPNEDRHFHAVDFSREVLAKHPDLAALHKASLDAATAESAAPFPANSFFGVYDGHGGSAAAAAAASRFHVLLASDPYRWRKTPAEALSGAFAALEAELRTSYNKDGFDKSGTCALTVLLRGHRLFVASVGDCRAVLLRDSNHAEPFVQITTDMRATLQSEARRVTAAGGQVSDGRGWGALIPSRTLGDFPWKDRGPGLIAIRAG